MRYVCLIYFDPRKVFDGSPASNAVLAAASTHNQSLSAKGQLVFAQPLALPDEAMTVQVRDGSLSAIMRAVLSQCRGYIRCCDQGGKCQRRGGGQQTTPGKKKARRTVVHEAVLFGCRANDEQEPM